MRNSNNYIKNANQYWRPKNISALTHAAQHIDKKQIRELFRRLNDSQIDAIYGALNYNVHSIQGPPATGKTNTCAHIAYLWWMLNQPNPSLPLPTSPDINALSANDTNWVHRAKSPRMGAKKRIKIHGMTPTNQGTLLLAQKCYEMNEIMEQAPTLRANTIYDGFIRSFYNLSSVPTSIRDLLLKFYYINKNVIKCKRFKVLYFASKTYSQILHIKVISSKKNAVFKNPKYDGESDGMTMIERLCVNLAAIHKLKLLSEYNTMSEREKEQWKADYMLNELNSADMICTTFGNSTHRNISELFEAEFTHSIADECNQSALDTFLGIIGYPNLRYLTMAGDVKQLSPVTMCTNKLTQTSVYEHIIKYLTNNTLKPNRYYTRLNKQYRSHPQIYEITTSIFYDNSVDINNSMQYIRAYKQNKKNYCKLFANHDNHIQFHILTNHQKEKAFDTSQSMRHSKYNCIEAQTAVKYLKKFIVELNYKEEEIAIISDYSAQVECVYTILTRLKFINEDKILLCTTNEIEGSSKPIVIYMCCRSNNTGNIGFLNDITRVNVATSRAEYGQIIIGDIYTLQYNPIYKQIFDIHQKYNAVVYEDVQKRIVQKNKNKNKKGKHNKTPNKKHNKQKNKKWLIFNLKTVSLKIPLVNISTKHFLDRRQYIQFEDKPQADYYICGGCDQYIFAKLFCGRIICAPPIFIYFCCQCINAYLCKYCHNKALHNKFSEISAMTIINKSDLNCNDSFGISLEFDLLLGRYLIAKQLIKFSNISADNHNNNIYSKFVDIASQIVNNQLLATNRDKIPECFRILSEYKFEESDPNIRSEINRNKAIGIIECKRNHLLNQAIMDARFFRLVYQIKNCKSELQLFYKCNKYTFYKYKELEENQPTLIVIAYLKACGYSTNIANYLHKKVSKILFDKNINILSRNTLPIELCEEEIDKLSEYLKLDQLTGTNNVLSTPIGQLLSGYYVIKLMQSAIINDPMSGYYERRKYKTAITKETNFGDDLKSAGFDYYSEKELQDLGYKETPDYYLKKPWIVCYNNLKHEITWIDFKYFYCSSTQWIIDKLRFQAQRYNKVFGPGAFIFSLGFVKIPNLLSLNSHGLLAALPLAKETMLKFINIRKKERQTK